MVLSAFSNNSAAFRELPVSDSQDLFLIVSHCSKGFVRRLLFSPFNLASILSAIARSS